MHPGNAGEPVFRQARGRAGARPGDADGVGGVGFHGGRVGGGISQSVVAGRGFQAKTMVSWIKSWTTW
jgi:hypothetical protein